MSDSDAIREAGIYDNSIIIYYRSGGINKGHGGKTMQEMETSFIIAGKNAKREKYRQKYDAVDCTSTVAFTFALKQP